MRNAATVSDFFRSLESFCQIINIKIFANTGVFWGSGLIIIGVLYVVKCYRNGKNNKQDLLFNLISGIIDLLYDDCFTNLHIVFDCYKNNSLPT